MNDAYYELGYVVKPHGLKGEINVYFDVDHPEKYLELESVFVDINQKLVPFFIVDIKVNDRKVILKLEEVDSIEKAKELQAKKIFLPESNLPELNEDQFYYHEIVGFEVHDHKLGKLGTVSEIFTRSGQDLIGMLYKNVEILVPVDDHVIDRADKQKKILFVKLPEGLLEIYLE